MWYGLAKLRMQNVLKFTKQKQNARYKQTEIVVLLKLDDLHEPSTRLNKWVLLKNDEFSFNNNIKTILSFKTKEHLNVYVALQICFISLSNILFDYLYEHLLKSNYD